MDMKQRDKILDSFLMQHPAMREKLLIEVLLDIRDLLILRSKHSSSLDLTIKRKNLLEQISKGKKQLKNLKGMSEQGLIKALREMEEGGYITKEKTGQGREYTIHLTSKGENIARITHKEKN